MDCPDLEWNPTASAPAHSALAGVLAGLVFAGIIMLFSDRQLGHQRFRAVILFAGALVVLATDSFLFGVVAGEQACTKAWTETMFAAGLLGLGAVGIFGGISWLFNTFDKDHGLATNFAKFLTYIVALIVALHLQVTAASYLNDIIDYKIDRPPSWLMNLVDVYTWAIIILVASTAITRGIIAARRRNASPPAKQHTGQRDGKEDKSVLAAAYLSAFYVIVVTTTSGLVLGIDREEWDPTAPAGMITTATMLALGVPTLSLIAQLWALPYRQMRPSAARADERGADARNEGA